MPKLDRKYNGVKRAETCNSLVKPLKYKKAFALAPLHTEFKVNLIKTCCRLLHISVLHTFPSRSKLHFFFIIHHCDPVIKNCKVAVREEALQKKKDLSQNLLACVAMMLRQGMPLLPEPCFQS